MIEVITMIVLIVLSFLLVLLSAALIWFFGLVIRITIDILKENKQIQDEEENSK